MTEAECDERDEPDGRPGAMADVSHTHPETRETFWTAYRRGPAVADGGSPRSNGRGTVRGRPAAPAAGGAETLADVDHEPPYSEPASVWSRGVGRTRDAGGDA